jgi:hypothetical protein
MRARELLQEDYNQQLESDLTNLLVGAKGSGASEVKTQDLVNQLHNMGYAVDVNSILSLLSNNPTVMNATPEVINMTQPEGSAQGPAGPTQDSAARVGDMAQKANTLG